MIATTHARLESGVWSGSIAGRRIPWQDGVDCKYMIDKTTPTGACAVTIMNKAPFGLANTASMGALKPLVTLVKHGKSGPSSFVVVGIGDDAKPAKL